MGRSQTASEYVAEMKQQEETERLKKSGSSKLAQFEKELGSLWKPSNSRDFKGFQGISQEYGDPDNATGAIKTPAELNAAAGPTAHLGLFK